MSLKSPNYRRFGDETNTSVVDLAKNIDLLSASTKFLTRTMSRRYRIDKSLYTQKNMYLIFRALETFKYIFWNQEHFTFIPSAFTSFKGRVLKDFKRSAKCT